MATESSTEGVLADLNRKSFFAENTPKTAREALAPVLADDFYIVRANGALQDEKAMLDAAEKDTGRVRSIENEAQDVSIRVYGNAAVVRTLLTVHAPDETLPKRYLNTKVFVKQDGSWKIAAWQVTEVKTAT